jgi:hypothetical protein
MAESEDLLGKADALMARHRPVQTPAEPDAEIPVLHEVVDLASLSDAVSLPDEREGSPPLGEEQIEALAVSIRASLLSALQPGIDSLIEERLMEGLAPRLETLVDELRRDLQLIARNTLRDAINTAVQKELGRRQFDAKP